VIERIKAVQQALMSWQLDGILLNRRDNLAWLTGGASFYVVERAETSVASFLITADRVVLLAPDNELPRILAEERLLFEYEIHRYRWYASLETALAPLRPERLGSDIPHASAIDVQHRMPLLRQGLNADETQRFRELGQEAAHLVEEVARGLTPGISERQVEADITGRCLARGIRPVCTLIAADERISLYKHPVPGTRRMVKKMLMTLGAERGGLNVSLTRMVHLGKPDDALSQRISALAEIHVDILRAVQVNRSWNSIFTDIRQAYQRHGWHDSWQDHHQGGPAGYGCRDWIVTPGTPGYAQADTAQAWNPTLSGVKSEDTFLLTDNGLQCLTRTDNWPLIDVVREGQRWQVADWLILPLSS